MWADTLLAAERAFLLRFAIWGALASTLGLSLLAYGAARKRRSPLVDQFAIQTSIWGLLALTLAIMGWSRLELRDFAGAANLERTVHFMIAFEAGMAGAGLVLLTRGRLKARPGIVGAGVGLLVQGAGWLALHLSFAAFLRAPLP